MVMTLVMKVRTNTTDMATAVAALPSSERRNTEMAGIYDPEALKKVEEELAEVQKKLDEDIKRTEQLLG